MLSIGKLSPGRADYYLDTVAKGAEEYYLGSGEAPGRWIGRGAERLGLTGEVGGARAPPCPRRTGRHRHARCSPARARSGCRASTARSTHRSRSRSCSPSAPTRSAARSAPRTTPRSMPHSRSSRAEACRVRRGRGGADGAARRRVRRRRVPPPHLPLRRPAPPHPRRGRQPRPLRERRPLDRARRPPALRVVPHRRVPLRGPPARRAHRSPRREWGPVRNGIADVAGIPTARDRALLPTSPPDHRAHGRGRQRSVVTPPRSPPTPPARPRTPPSPTPHSRRGGPRERPRSASTIRPSPPSVTAPPGSTRHATASTSTTSTDGSTHPTD